MFFPPESYRTKSTRMYPVHIIANTENNYQESVLNNEKSLIV